MQLKINLYFFNLNFSSKKRITVNFLTFKGFKISYTNIQNNCKIQKIKFQMKMKI